MLTKQKKTEGPSQNTAAISNGANCTRNGYTFGSRKHYGIVPSLRAKLWKVVRDVERFYSQQKTIAILIQTANVCTRQIHKKRLLNEEKCVEGLLLLLLS